MSLDPQAFSPVGATTATGMLLPGATNATLANHPVDPSNFADRRVAARLPFNRGAGSFSSVYDVAAPQEFRSLGEVAAELRARRNQVARTITNQDIDRVNQQPGVTVGGTTGAAVNASSPSHQPGASEMPTVSAPTPAPEPLPEPSREMAQVTTPTEDTVEQPAEDSNQLPMSSSSLPLLALFGLLSGAAGILWRRQ
jgi:hypothetical protein